MSSIQVSVVYHACVVVDVATDSGHLMVLPHFTSMVANRSCVTQLT